MRNIFTLILSVFFILPLAGQQQLINIQGGSMTLENGASLKINGNLQSSGTITNDGEIELKGNLIALRHAGVFQPAEGTLTFNGSNPQLIAGVGLSLNDINVENDLILFGDLSVKESLNMFEGSIDMNGHLLELDSGVNLNGEIETFQVKGNGILRASAVLDQPYMVSPGNIGLTITSDTRLGKTIVEREHRIIEFENGETSCSVIYSAHQDNRRGDMNALVALKYCDALEGLDESNLTIFRYNNLEGAWSDIGGVANPLSKTVWQSGVPQMSTWTIGERLASSFNVTLLDISATPFTNRVVIDWSTMNESEMSHFEVERGTGQQFIYIGSVEARNAEQAAYSFTDLPGSSGIYFYRVRMVGQNGETIRTRTVMAELVIQTSLEVYPNPALAGQHIELKGFTGPHTVEMYDLFGRQVLQEEIEENQQILLADKLAGGVYVYSIKGHNQTILQGKLVIK